MLFFSSPSFFTHLFFEADFLILAGVQFSGLYGLCCMALPEWRTMGIAMDAASFPGMRTWLFQSWLAGVPDDLPENFSSVASLLPLPVPW